MEILKNYRNKKSNLFRIESGSVKNPRRGGDLEDGSVQGRRYKANKMNICAVSTRRNITTG